MFISRKHVGMLLLFGLMVWCGGATPRAEASDEWLTSYDKAVEEATATGKLILADFSGSDWCGWCIKLKNEVFDKSEFKKWAKENVVLLEVDFPRRTPQPTELKQQNQQLMQKYGIRGFPTVLFLQADGSVAGRMGYLSGGPGKWTERAQQIVDKHPRVQVAKPLTSLADALASSKKSGLPLLLFLARAGEDAVQTELDKLYGNAEFVKMASKALTVAQVARPLDARAGNTEKSALEGLLKRYQIKDESLAIVLLDTAKDEVLYRSNFGSVNAGILLPALRKALPAVSYSAGWLDNYSGAKLVAAQQGRHVLLLFTKGPQDRMSAKLDQEILQDPVFLTYAGEKLVLVKLDFSGEAKLPDELKKQNDELASTYGVRTFPTIIVLDAEGQLTTILGYERGGGKSFVRRLERYIK